MALVVADRVQETTSTTGTSDYVLIGAATGYQSFGAVMSNADTTYYAITNDTDWEVGIGTYSTTGPTLARTTILASSNGGSAVNWGVGVKNIFISYAASKASFLDASGDLLVADKIVHTGDTDTAIRFPAANTMSVETGGTERFKVENGTITTTVPVLLPADPTLPLQAATKEYVDTIASAGIHYHAPVRVESPINLNATYNNGTSGVGATLTNAGTQVALVIDGVTVATNDRVLVYEQTDQTQNGVYVVTNTGSGSTNWVLTRSSDTDTYGPSDPDGLGGGDAFFVQQGTTGAGELYVCNNSGAITFGTTNITFTQIAATAVYTAGSGLTLTGTVFANAAPDQTVTLTQGGATTITGTYPNFTITSTDTTYTAGGGIGLTTTEFSVAAGSGLTQDADGLSHADTSSQSSVNNTGADFIQDVTLDTFGHVTGLASVTVTPSLIGAPQNDGTGATGTWGISISGNSANVNGTVAVANGGTGATTAAQALNNLGLTATAAELNTLDGITATVTELNYTDGVTSAIQTQLDNKQPLDADLTAIAALAVTDGNFIVGNGTTWVAESGATARTSLGLAIGTNVQAWDANLDQIAALAPTADNFIVGNGTAWTLETPASALASLGVTATAAELNFVDGVTSAIQTQLDSKAPLASPALTGTPTAPTATVGTNTTQVATTAFVNAEIANDAPTKTGTGASGTWSISVTGNAGTATQLATSRSINGIGFNGTQDISVPDLRGTNGTVLIDGTGVTSGVNYVSLTNAATGGTVSLSTTGADTNIPLEITTKGTGAVTVATAGGAINMRPGTSGLRIFDDSNVYYHNVATGTMTANRTLTLPNASVTLVSGTMVPTTGTGATGTWGISISGNAATATTLTGLTATVAELNYTDGVTSAIQTQLNARYTSADLATQAEAEAGTDNTSLMTPLRTFQAIKALTVNVQEFTAGGTWTKPADAVYSEILVVGGGRAGQVAVVPSMCNTGTVAIGGNAGGTARLTKIASALGATETVTIGAGGATSLAVGGTSSFGAHASATGGGASPGVGSGTGAEAITGGRAAGTGSFSINSVTRADDPCTLGGSSFAGPGGIIAGVGIRGGGGGGGNGTATFGAGGGGYVRVVTYCAT